MPETRLERAVFVLGLVAIVALALAIVDSRHRSSGAPRPTSPAAATPAGRRTTTRPTAPTTTATTSTEIELALTASHDSWVDVRAGSATAKELYTGILSSATTKTFRASSLWVRFGSASNLAATLGGRPLRLPAGTYSAVFDRSGFRRVSG
jgi:RodZ C-terminal domain